MTDWHAIRAEYIAGGISLRKLSEKYDIPFTTIQKKCFRERWTESREKAKIKVTENVIQKTAEKTADVATMTKDLQKKLLLKLSEIIDAYTWECTEHREYMDGETYIWKLTDVTRAFRDVIGTLPEGINESGSPLLYSLYELMRKGS